MVEVPDAVAALSGAGSASFHLSGEHFSLNARAGGISFRNHSRHGTYVNGRKFEKQTLVLQEGDVLLAGKSVFALVSDGPAGELKTPGEIVGASEAMRSIISRIPDIASKGRTVLLHG